MYAGPGRRCRLRPARNPTHSMAIVSGLAIKTRIKMLLKIVRPAEYDIPP